MIPRQDASQAHRSGFHAQHMGLACLACLLLVLSAAVLAQPVRPPSSAPAPDSQVLTKEYQDRLGYLEANDVKGHFALAEWCRDQKLYGPLLRQAQYVLQLDPANEGARQLYRLAVDQMKAHQSQSRPADESPLSEYAQDEFITPEEIQRLKWAEFLDPSSPIGIAGERGRPPLRTRPGGRTEEFLQVRYDGKVLDEFFELMSGNPGFSSREDRARLHELPPTQQVQMIRHFTGSRFADRIEIINDPLVFRQFQKVMPLVSNTCGSLTCHGGPNAQVWRLRTSRTRSNENLYTNFFILNRVRRGGQRLVNREKPEESLLIQFSLPRVQAHRLHPDPIPIVFPKGKSDVRYGTVMSWIQTLRVPEPQTRVTLPGYPIPLPPQFGGTPKKQEEAETKAKHESPTDEVQKSSP